MELQDLIIVIFMTLCGIGALVLVLLQKKGIIKQVLTQNVNEPDFMSGGKILLFATAMGAYTLFKYDKVLSILYVVLFFGIYILIQIIWRNRE